MIHHVSVPVGDLERGLRFYEQALKAIGHRVLIRREANIGFGDTYPAFWINLRAGPRPASSDGHHVALRCRDAEAVRSFHTAALAADGTDDGPPGLRPEYTPTYYAAFIRDPDGNRIEAVTFLEAPA